MPKFDSQKMYTYLKGFAMGANMEDTVKALAFAREMHNGQTRKSGEPYIVHPLTLASHAIALGIKEDAIVATMLLHDVVEDCSVSSNKLPVSAEVRKAVTLLTYEKPKKLDEEAEEEYNQLLKLTKDQYYLAISQNRVASLVKIFDRCHNVSSMIGAFTNQKVESYIEETKKYILPLIRTTKDSWPELSDTIFALKYHIHSVIDALEILCEVKDTK